MMWDVSDEHEVCYKDKDVLKKVNDLTDLFDDILQHSRSSCLSFGLNGMNDRVAQS